MIFALVISESCSKSDEPAYAGPAVNQALINGWWYRGPTRPVNQYKGYFFGSDGKYQQDGSNLGLPMGNATWSWLPGNVVKIVPISGMFPGETQLTILKLTSDSLVGKNTGGTLRLGRTNHN